MHIHVLAHSLKRTRVRYRLDLLGLPGWVRKLGFSGLEVSDRELAGLDEETLRLFSSECTAKGCGLIVDINVDFTTSNPARLQEEIDHGERMIQMASALGAKNMRICLGGQRVSVQKYFNKRRNPTQAKTADKRKGRWITARFEQKIMRLGHLLRSALPARTRGLEGKTRIAIHALKEIAKTAAGCGVRIGIENHWGISGDPENIVAIVSAVDSPHIGTCPDLGNFPHGIDPLVGLRRLAPAAVILHAKSYGFDENGEEKSIDYSQCLAIFRKFGFSGPVTVEYEGPMDDLEGCRLTRELLLRHWREG